MYKYDEQGQTLINLRLKSNKRTKEYFRRFKERDPEGYKEMYRMRNRKKSSEQRMLEGARRRARKDGYEPTLKREDIVIPDLCPILGIKLSRGNTKIQPNSPSLDKVNPHGLYEKNNIRVISYEANKIKSYLTPELCDTIKQYMLDNWPN